jgi:hypothetical protein
MFNGLAVLSLVLCVATVVLWVRSYYHTDMVSRIWPYWGVSVDTGKGGVCIVLCRQSFEPNHIIPELAGTHWWTSAPSDVRPAWQRGGFAYYHFLKIWGRYSYDQWDFAGPYWLPTAVGAILPLYALRRLRKRIRQKIGHCLSCGYNLTGNVSGVCPECGTPISNKDTTVKG